MGRGLSELQRWLLDRPGRQHAPAKLARDFYGTVTPAGRAAVSRALSRLRQKGLLALTKKSPRWALTVNEKARVERADCLSFLASLPPKSVDLVFGSPNGWPSSSCARSARRIELSSIPSADLGRREKLPCAGGGVSWGATCGKARWI
jgi:hypothetical protein